MIKKYGMTIQYWVLATLMFAAVFSLAVIAMGGFSIDSGLSNNLTDTTITTHYNSLDQNINNINQSVSALKQPGGLTLLTGFQAFLGGTTAILNIVFGSMGLIPSLFVNFASDFGIPSVVANVFFVVVSSVITILIIFAILNAAKAGGRV